MRITGSGSKKFAAYSLKALGTAMLWISTTALAKMRFAPEAKGWQAVISQLPLWSVIGLAFFLPVTWLVVEFVTTCFLELRIQMLERTAPRVVQWSSELPNIVREVLGRWFDWCQAWFDRWQFDGRYRKRMAEESQHLHTQTGLLHATAGFSLERAYTELDVASTQYRHIDQSLLGSKSRGRESIYSFLRAQQAGTTLAVLGRPGGGKTTLVRHLALLYAADKQGRYRLRRRLPILIELRRVTEMFSDKPGTAWKSPSLSQVIRQYWKQQSAWRELMSKAPVGWLKSHLAGGRVLIMVDGLDEVPHLPNAENRGSLTPRERVSQWMETEMQRDEQRSCLFLITSRPGGFAEAPLKHRVTVVEVQPLTPQQIERSIYAFQFGCQITFHPSAKLSQHEAEAAKATAKLQQEWRSKPHLADLQVNPLLLHMVCLLHHLRGRLPADRIDLYKETCEVLLNRDLRAPGIVERLRPEDKFSALRPLADYFMRSQSPEPKSTAELLPVIQPVFATLNFPASEFFDYTAQDSGLLQEVEQERWDFAHKTFYEYLTAEYWDRHPPSIRELAEWVEQDWWRVTLLFYSAKADDSPVIKAALAQSETPRAWSLAFACLAAGHRINAEERTRAYTRLEKALSNPADIESFVPAAKAFLDLRMREMIPTSQDGRTLRRSALITRAEYQLFLLSRPPEERFLLVPPHWSHLSFRGDPTAPLLGVTPRQAEEFVEWIGDAAERGWQLPRTSSENAEVYDGCWIIDHTSSGRTDARIGDETRQIKNMVLRWAAANGLTYIGDESWESLLVPHMVRRHYQASYRFSFAEIRESTQAWAFRVLHRDRRLARERALIGLGVFCDITSAVRMVVDTYSMPRHYQDEHLPYYHRRLIWGHDDLDLNSLGTAALIALEVEEQSHFLIRWAQVVADLFSQIEDGRAISPHSLCRSLASVFARVCGFTALARAFLSQEPDLPFIERAIKGEVREAQEAAAGAFSNRLRMLVAAAEVVVTQHDRLKHRLAWLRYGISWMEVLLPHQNAASRRLIYDYYCLLKLLEARASGAMDPWEGILLVRSI